MQETVSRHTYSANNLAHAKLFQQNSEGNSESFLEACVLCSTNEKGQSKLGSDYNTVKKELSPSRGFSEVNEHSAMGKESKNSILEGSLLEVPLYNNLIVIMAADQPGGH